MRKKVNLSLEPETAERLKQYADEHHTTVSGAITAWIWSVKVKDEVMKGQIRTETDNRLV